jgi:hypothetical protein
MTKEVNAPKIRLMAIPANKSVEMDVYPLHVAMAKTIISVSIEKATADRGRANRDLAANPK